MTSTCKTSEMQNPSWFLYGPGSASIQDISIPTIKNDHDVLVRIRYIGVCGSDVYQPSVITGSELTIVMLTGSFLAAWWNRA
jgi:NADPH:quinone reductase-like Zn-dependent oxidoreductase